MISESSEGLPLNEDSPIGGRQGISNSSSSTSTSASLSFLLELNRVVIAVLVCGLSGTEEEDLQYPCPRSRDAIAGWSGRRRLGIKALELKIDPWMDKRNNNEKDAKNVIMMVMQ
mmetsp:Transcript_16334/g.23833  ORF Transcript_16334/g.23833 Transcript_16334/m.23833 type:complete len:115 (+) Transcript_16334:594-938(+)